MARNQPDDYNDDDPGYSESGTHSGGSMSSPSTYSTSSPSSPAAHGTLGANGLTSADMDLSGMGEPSSKPAVKTTPRSSDPPAPSPTSMAKKRANQPR